MPGGVGVGRIGLFVVALAAPSIAAAYDAGPLTIHGYSSFEYERQIEKAGEGAGDPNGSFDADLFDLVLSGQVTPRTRVAADVTWEHGAATEDGRGNVAIEYGFVEYAIADALKLRAGKMFTPFGIYNEIHTAKPTFLTVKEAPSTNKPSRIVEDAMRFYPRWGAGVEALGNIPLGGVTLDYSVLVGNGDQENTNPFEEDDNEWKSTAARVRIGDDEHFELGASFYYDRFAPGGTDESIMSGGAELKIQLGPSALWAEAMVARLKDRAGGTRQQVGGYVQPSYRFDFGLTPYFRLDYIEPNTDVPDDWGVCFTAGLNFELDLGLFLKLENDYFRGGARSSLAAFPGHDYNEIKAAVVLGF